MMFRLTTLLASLMTIAMIQGCTVLPERSAKATYMLPSPNMQSGTETPVPLTLRVLTPQAESPLDGTRILVNPDGQAIQIYAGARWSKPTPVLIRDHWVDGLRQNGGLKAVVSETSDASSDLSLSSDLNSFRIQYQNGQPVVIIHMDAQVLDSRSRRVIAAERFEVEQSLDDEPIDSVVTGFGNASQALTEKLVAWLLAVSREVHKGSDQ